MKFIIKYSALLYICLTGLNSTFGQTILSSEAMSGTNFQFVINGSASATVDILGSTDLVNWVNLGSNTLSGGGTYTFVDTTAGLFTNRFYCVQQGTNCSSNTVGFINVVVPAKNADGSSAYIPIANQLNNPSGSNTIDVLFDALPRQSQVLKWNTGSQGYDVAQKGGTPPVWNNNLPLDPTQGTALVHAGGSNSVLVTFVGEVPQGPQVNTNFPTTVGYLSLLSTIVPREGNLNELVFPAVKGDIIEQWDNTAQQWVTNATYTNGYWSPAPPSLPIGQSFFLRSGSSSNRIWIEDFPIQPCAQEQPWSFIQIGDLHAGIYLRSAAWTNTLNTIIASNQSWNLKLIVSPGDCYEQATNGIDWNGSGTVIGGKVMTNNMWQIKAAGISWMNVPGNHDSDIDFDQRGIAYWNDVFGTNFYASDPYWFSNRIVGDTRDMAFKFTNGTTKMLFVGLRWVNPSDSQGVFNNTNDIFTAYSTNCGWASNLARAYPDHLVVPVMHYFMDTNGTPNVCDIPGNDPNAGGYINEGPGIVCWDALKSATNLMMILSGHVRARQMVRSPLQCDDGHMVDSILFNTQTGPTEGTNTINNGGCFVLYTVFPSEHYVRGRVFESDWGRFMTNGEFINHGFVNDWTFPFKRLP